MRPDLERQTKQMADFVFTVVGTKVIDRPGCIVVNILKDRTSGETGMKIVQADWLIGKTSYDFR